MDQVFNPLLDRRVKITFPLLLQKGNHRCPDRQYFLLHVRYNVLIVIVEKGDKCFEFFFFQGRNKCLMFNA